MNSKEDRGLLILLQDMKLALIRQVVSEDI